MRRRLRRLILHRTDGIRGYTVEKHFSIFTFHVYYCRAAAVHGVGDLRKEKTTMNATYTLNAEKNGVEIRFASKPAADVLEAIKAAGYRWSRAQRLWWARQSEKTLKIAMQIANAESAETVTSVTTESIPDLWERTRWTPGPGGDDCHARFVGSNYKRGMSNKEIAATVKKHLSQRFPGTKWSVTTAGYNSVNVYLVSAPYENAKGCENMREWAEKSPELSAIEDYARQLLKSYNYDDSDSMTDYFDVNFYETVGIAYNYKQTEPTKAQTQEIEAFRARIAEEQRKEEERQEREWEEEKARRAEAAKEFERREAEAHAAIEVLKAAATVRALEESEQYIIPGAPLARKASDLNEAREAAEENAVDISDCIILEEITAPAELLNAWGEKALLHDVPELFRAVGGSRTFDARIGSMIDYHNMDADERESVKWYTLATAIYTTTGELWAVVDDEGYNYARYIAVAPWDGCAERLPIPAEPEQNPEVLDAARCIEDISTETIEKLDLCGGDWKTSEDYKNAMEPHIDTITREIVQAVSIDDLKMWLYRRMSERNSIRERLTRANIPVGERVTIIKESDFGGISTTTATWSSWEPVRYAQYNDAAKIIIKPKHKRGLHYMTLHRGPSVLIVSGNINLPDSLFWEDLPGTMEGVTMRKSRFTSCDPAAMEAVREYLREHGAKVYIDYNGK